MVGSECGAAACADNTSSTLLAPALTSAGAALTPLGKPLSSIVTASLKPARRVTLASTRAVPPGSSTTLSVSSVKAKDADGGGVTITGGVPLPLSGAAVSLPPEPPHAARPSASTATTVIVDCIACF